MILEQLTLLNYKNVAEAELRLSPNVNCFIGANGMGKTNVLDAIYFLSFGKSATALTDRPTATACATRLTFSCCKGSIFRPTAPATQCRAH